MIKYQDMLGKTAYSLEEGRQWGKVVELFVDKKTYKVTGMVIRGEEDRFLPYAAARKIDESIVFKSSFDFMTLSESEPGAIRGSKITGLRVISETGNESGTLVSFFFNKEDGAITHYEISKSVLSENRLMSHDGMVRMGEDAMIISEEAAEVTEEMKAKAGFKSAAAKLGVKLKKAGLKMMPAMEKAKEAAKKGIKTAGEKTDEFAAKARPKIKEAVDKYGPRVKEGAEKAGAKAKELADKAGPKMKEAAGKYGPKIKDAGEKAKDAVKNAWDKMTQKNKKKT